MTNFTNNDVSSGATVFASDHNTQGALIAAVLNGGIDNANINASAAIATSKLADDAGITTAKIGSAAVTTAKIATNAVTSTLLALSNALDATNGVQSQANAGTAGGTMWWINLGGIKILWGHSGVIAAITAGTAKSFTLPAFFTTVQTVLSSPNNPSATGSIYCENDTYSTSSVNLKITPATNTNLNVDIWAIGT